MEDKTKQEVDKKRQRRRGNPHNNKDKDKKLPPEKICMNDPNWYVLHPELLKDAASLPFSHFLGRGFALESSAGNRPKEGIVTKISYLYSFGVTASPDDPVNLAIRNLYTYVRHQNSGHTNYEAADLGLYLLATSGVIATLAHLERLIGLAKCYERRSVVMPRDLLMVLGVNPATLISNLANYTLRLNVMWQRVSSLCIPKDFSFLKRWIWMNSQVFKDHESDKAALYVFKPVGVPLFNKFTLDAGSISQPTDENLTPTIDDWFVDCENALSAILEDEDMNIMSGDILKAYGSENLLHFGLTPLDYIVKPVYVEEMLPQIQHLQTPVVKCTTSGPVIRRVATGINYDVAQSINDQTNAIYSAAQNIDYFTIYQWNGVVISTPCPVGDGVTAATVDATSGALFWDTCASDEVRQYKCNTQVRILSSTKEVVPPEDIMIATRLMYLSDRDTRVTNNPIYYTSCGSEIVTKCTVYYKEAFGNLNIMGYDCGSFYHFSSNNAAFATVTPIENLISQFDWRPFMYVSENYSSGGPEHCNCNRFVFGEIDNFTLLAPATLEGLHLTALLAEFSVSQYNLIK